MGTARRTRAPPSVAAAPGTGFRTVIVDDVDYISCPQEAIERGSSWRHKKTTLAKEIGK
jgi:hypothetical protein